MKLFALALSGAVLALASAPAVADNYTLGVQYFSVTPGGDFGTQGGSNLADLVKSTLGPDGLPVYNSSNSAGITLSDVNANGELTWWSPSMNSRVTATGSGTVTTPFSQTNFFAPNGTGTSNANAFLTAIFSGVMNLPTAQSVSFTFGGDDDIFLFVDGQSVGQLGGIHGYTQASPTTATLAAGPHTFSAFYADRQQVAAQVGFTINTNGLTVTPGVPEPATWAMMLLGFGGIGVALRRKRNPVLARA